jgi:hypothetical protein
VPVKYAATLFNPFIANSTPSKPEIIFYLVLVGGSQRREPGRPLLGRLLLRQRRFPRRIFMERIVKINNSK